MELKKIDYNQLHALYHTAVQADFPAAEIKPWSRIAEFYERGTYDPVAMYDGDLLAAYALFYRPDGEGAVPMIDYLAVHGEARGRGYGSSLLGLLNESCRATGIVIEVENPAFAESDERLREMTRRIAFYERNDFRMTAVETRVFSVEYSVMIAPVSVADAAARDAVERVYRSMFEPAVYDSEVEIRFEEAHG